jgi:hypothetical protein
LKKGKFAVTNMAQTTPDIIHAKERDFLKKETGPQMFNQLLYT